MEIKEEKPTKPILEPTNDYVFKRIFGYKGNEVITIDFIKAVTGVKYKKIELNDTPILERDLINDKLGILDVKVETGEVQVDIEMQVSESSYIAERLLFYWSKMYGKKIEKGEPYSKANKTIAILVAKCKIEELKGLKEYHSKWRIIEDEHRELVLTDKFEIHIIELEKLKRIIGKREINKKDELERWCRFLLEPRKVGEEDMDENEAIKKAREVLEEISQDENERYKAELREKYVKDQMAIQEHGFNKGVKKGRREGKKEGIKEGIKQGVQQEKVETAKKMKIKGMKIEDIIEVTGLTKEEIEEL